MLIEPILLALFIGWVLKGNFKNLIDLPVTHLFLPILIVVLEVVSSAVHVMWPLGGLLTLMIQCVIYSLLMFFFFLNRQVKGMRIIGFGVLLNACVITANGGYMPVSTDMAEHFGFLQTLTELKRGELFGHIVMTRETVLNLLGDWIHIPPPYWFPKSVSPGDLVMDLGFVTTIISGMKGDK